MADSTSQPDPVAMPSARDDSTPILTGELEANVKTEQVSTTEPKGGEQTATKIERVTEQSKSVGDHGGDATGIKTENDGTGEPVKKENASENGTYQKSSMKGSYKHRNNSKFDPSVADVSSDPVEFYFSDSNLPMDKFLFSKVGGVENKPISLKMIATFKRMKRFQPYEAIVAALKDSQFLDLTENEEVKRKVPLEPTTTGKTVHEAHQKWEDKTMDRSIYAKGFGEETPTTQFEIEAFFAPYGPTNAIRLRRMASDRTFKGSVFVEFQDSSTQQNFLALEPKPKWKGEADLLWKSKRDYVDEKDRDIKAGKIKPNPSWNPGRNIRKEGVHQDDWKKRREQDQKSGFQNSRNGRGRGGRGGHGAKPSGRGGRGGRGDRGNGRERRERDPHQVPKIRTSTPEEAPPPKDYVPPFSTGVSPESSKKRAREDCDAAKDITEKKAKVESTAGMEVKIGDGA